MVISVWLCDPSGGLNNRTWRLVITGLFGSGPTIWLKT
jgi:hypothetical protein